MFGMLGLAVDAGRAYVDRRELQNAVDAATLGAGDYYENYGDQTGAFNHAFNIFQRVLTLNGGSSSISGSTMTASWGSGYSLTISGANGQFNGYVFQATAQHTFPLTFFQVLGTSPTIPVNGVASAIVGNQTSQPALLTLSQSGCSLTLGGNTAVTVRGDVYSDGCISFTGSASLGVAGSTYSHVGTPPSGITTLCYNPDPTVPPHGLPCTTGETYGSLVGGAPPILDPRYRASDSLFQTSDPAQISHTGWTELQPGVFHNFALTGGAGCYFFDPGVYTWSGGYTSHGGFSSNELKPPDEPGWNYSTNSLDYTALASPQFYNTFRTCAGSVTVTGQPGGSQINPASSDWYVEVTSVRSDAYPPSGNPGSTTYARESAPSTCHAVDLTGANKWFTVDVGTSQQVPGATSYNVYIARASSSTCTNIAQTSYGYVGTFTESVHKINVDGSLVPSGSWWLNARDSRCTNPTSLTVGCAPPDGLTKPVCFINCTGSSNNGLADENPPSKIYPQGDLANENACSPQSTNAAVPCQGASVTPGAVHFYFGGNGDCISENGNGATYVFSGIQYSWISIYEPQSNSSCGNSMNGGSATEYIGTVYTPTSSWTINGGNRAPLSGQVIASTATLNGNGTIGINFNPNYAPPPPAARLVQ